MNKNRVVMDHSDFAREYKKEELPIRKELEAIGIFTDDIYSYLPGNKGDWKKATPVIVKYLTEVNNRGLQEALVRLLCVPWLRKDPVGKTLMEMAFAPSTDFYLKWAIGNTIEVIAEDSLFDEIARFVSDKTFGTSRQMFVLGLGRIKKPEAIHLLISLLDQEEVNGHAISALNKLKAVESIEKVRLLVNDPRAWVRTEAKKTVAKFEKIISEKK